MKKAIETALLVIGVICFIFICSEPAEGTSLRYWLTWEFCWFAGLLADLGIAALLSKKGVIFRNLRHEC